MMFGALAACSPLSDPNCPAKLFGVRLVGVNYDNLHKLLLSLGLIVGLVALRYAFAGATRALLGGRHHERLRFWVRQGLNLTAAFIGVLGVLSVWFNDPNRLVIAVGVVTAGLSFALQQVVTALAGYVVILRGNTFSVGDRIVMGGVRGDVIALGFIQTTIMEMGQPASVQTASPAMWIHSRQYTGRIVTITNDKIFDEPVYNYTRDFPYLWEEIPVPIPYDADRARAERILLECARRHTVPINAIGHETLEKMQRRYALQMEDMMPRVYYRLTDNWLELSVRFMVLDHGIRDVKDAMSRDLLQEFDRAGLAIASATYDIVGLPPVRFARVADGGRTDGDDIGHSHDAEATASQGQHQP